MVNSWERKAIFRTCPVEISVIDAHAPFATRLLYHDDIGEPGGVLLLPNDTGAEEFLYFFLDGRHSFIGEVSPLLADRSLSFINPQLVRDYFGRYARHVLGGLCEYIVVGPEKLCQRVPEIGRERGSNLSGVFLLRANLDSLSLFGGFWSVLMLIGSKGLNGIDRVLF